MQLGMIGLGRMGADMVRRLLKGSHDCVVFDINADARAALAKDGATAADSLDVFVQKLSAPRAVWLMVPAAITDRVINDVAAKLSPGDIIIDGGNSHYPDSMRRAKTLAVSGVHFADVGTSGGIWGRERGYSLMVGAEPEVFARLEPVFATLASGPNTVPATPNANAGTAASGYLHCGAHGAGHFVKMIHNGIEYGMMASIAEGLNVLARANAGMKPPTADAETSPLEHPELYQYNFDLPKIAEVWRRGSVVSSWLLDLTAAALATDPTLGKFDGRVSDSGEGRWTITAAIDESVPVPVLSAALFERFSSRNEGEFAGKVLSAMRAQFGGHAEKPREPRG
jgi:6-phosphogluconate dehydrogenase